MTVNPPDPKSIHAAENQADVKRNRPLLGIIIGLGALAIVLMCAAVAGGLLYTWFLRVPQATLPPLLATLSPEDVTPAPQVDQLPTGSVPAVATEGIPQITVSPTLQESGLLPETSAVSYVIIVNVKSLNVRTGPGSLYPVVITYPEGTRLLAIGRNEDASWFVISLSTTQLGWVSVPLVRYDFDRYVLPVFPAPPLEIILPTPYGGAMLVPPELRGSQPLANILPARRLMSLAVASLLTAMLAYLERNKLARVARTSLRQVLVLGAHLFSH